MGCFLTMTDRDLAQLRGALKTAVSVLGTAGPGQVKIQVSDVGYRNARQMAALIRHETQSARVSTDDGRHASPMRERRQYQLTTILTEAPSLLNHLAQATQQAFTLEMLKGGKPAEHMAAAILQQSGYMAQIGRITRARGMDIIGTSKAGQDVIVEVKFSGLEMEFGQRMSKGAYRNEAHPHGMRQMGDPWIGRTTPGVDPAKAHILGVHIDPIKEQIAIYRRMDSEARHWKLLHQGRLSDYDLSAFK